MSTMRLTPTIISESTVMTACSTGIVAGADGVEGEGAHARPVEHPLHDDDAAEKAAELEAEIGDERDGAVTQRMLVQHLAFAVGPWRGPP